YGLLKYDGKVGQLPSPPASARLASSVSRGKYFHVTIWDRYAVLAPARSRTYCREISGGPEEGAENALVAETLAPTHRTPRGEPREVSVGTTPPPKTSSGNPPPVLGPEEDMRSA